MQTEAELKAQGYVFHNKGLCRGCEAPILWYDTPAGKRIPVDAVSLVPHWGICPKGRAFRERSERAFKRIAGQVENAKASKAGG